MFTPTGNFLLDAAARAMAEAFPKPTPERIVAALDRVFVLADQSWDATRMGPAFRLGNPGIACKAGCGWCCHQQVGVSVPEAIRIAVHIRALPPAESDAVLGRVRALDDATNGLTTSMRAAGKWPCAFLVDGACTIYAVRPLRCRGLQSTDAGFCRKSFEDPEATRAGLALGTVRPTFLAQPQHIYDQILNGVLKTLHFAKVADYGLELTAAIRELTDQPRRMTEWLRQPRAARSAALVPDPGADTAGQLL